ncbi:hypothetical protein ACJX0J_042107, partial [Zea mays]
MPFALSLKKDVVETGNKYSSSNEMGNIWNYFWNYAVHSLEELDSPFTEKEFGAGSLLQRAQQNSKNKLNVPEDCVALIGQLQPFNFHESRCTGDFDIEIFSHIVDIFMIDNLGSYFL